MTYGQLKKLYGEEIKKSSRFADVALSLGCEPRLYDPYIESQKKAENIFKQLEKIERKERVR